MILSQLTIEQRFDREFSNGRAFAPLSNGNPKMLYAIDKSCFEKDNLERGRLITEKKKHPKTRNHKFKRQLIGAF